MAEDQAKKQNPPPKPETQPLVQTATQKPGATPPAANPPTAAPQPQTTATQPVGSASSAAATAQVPVTKQNNLKSFL